MHNGEQWRKWSFCAPKRLDGAVANGILVLFGCPGGGKVTFPLKCHFSAPFPLFRSKAPFCEKVTFGSKSGFRVAPPPIWALFSKGLGPSAPSVIFDDGETTFAEHFTEISWNF